MTMSIVIPVFNEEIMLPALIPQLLGGEVEVLVVDGGSTDSTREIARQFPVTVLTAPRGRAAQMNLGAAAATGGWLWFLHADSRVPGDWRAQLFGAIEDPELVGGAFRTVIDASGLRYRILDAWGRCRPAFQRSFFGDQGIFVRRDLFERLGGFSPHAIVEDVEFSNRLWRLGKVVLLPGPLRTSARRWERAGWRRTVAAHCRLMFTQPAATRAAAPRITVVIMAKAPVPGQVKTRLVPPLTPGQAAAIAARLLQETAGVVERLRGVDRVVAVAPADALEQVRPIVPPSFRLVPQRGATLGARLTGLFQEAFADGVQGVIAVGADHPQLPIRYLEMAVAALRRSRDEIVLGPTEDGGYYLIGLSRPHPELFCDIPWSSSGVLDATCVRARRLGLAVHRLPGWFDLDRPEDLVRFSMRNSP